MAVIDLENVRKAYRRRWSRGSLRDAIPQMLGRVVGNGGRDRDDLLWALDGVSFCVERGETLGIVGPNGAGKTTILKLLSRVTRPTSGQIAVSGRVSALIELGAGFHPDLSGRENVYLNGTILGLNRRQIDERFDSIVEFAELAEFIDMPVKRYSSGMYVRLGFAVAAHVDPEVLLVDEVLAVGDYMFQDKCIQRIKEFREMGKAMVVVTHNKQMIEKLCNRAVLLHKGRVVCQGDTRETLDRYHLGFTDESVRTQQDRRQRLDVHRPMEITGLELLGGDGNRRQAFLTAEPMVLRIHFRANAAVTDPVFYSRVCRGHQELHGSNTSRFEISGEYDAGDVGVAEVRYHSINLLDGTYGINVGINRDHFSRYSYDRIDRAVEFSVGSRFDQGAQIVHLPHRWEVSRHAGE